MSATASPRAPGNAFYFDACECQFAAPTARTNGVRRMPVNVLARTGQPVWHWYWEWIVHDLDGMTHKPTIAFDYRHDPDEPLGFANKIERTGGNLYLGGELLSRHDGDEAARIMDLGPAGVPYEQSIHFDPRSVVLEYLPDGATTSVNGQSIKGPVTIMRQWELLRCAFVLTGVDGGTSANFEEKEANRQFELTWKNGVPERFRGNDSRKPTTFESLHALSASSSCSPAYPQHSQENENGSGKPTAFEDLFRGSSPDVESESPRSAKWEALFKRRD